MSIKIIATCNNCKTDIDVGTHRIEGDGVVCMECWTHDSKDGAEELAAVRASRKAVFSHSVKLSGKLQNAIEQIKQGEIELNDNRLYMVGAQARIAELEAALAAREEDLLPLMSERLARALDTITDLRAEVTELDTELTNCRAANSRGFTAEEIKERYADILRDAPDGQRGSDPA
jgi:chromosome segregation ATPase